MTAPNSPASGALPPGRPGRPGLILAVCCSALFMVWLDATAVGIGLPAIARSLHAQLPGLQWTVDGYTVVLASLLLSAGALADRAGRRTIFQAGLAAFTLGSWLCSVAPSLPALIGFRLLQGAGGAMLSPCALGIITATFTAPRERRRALGAWEATIGLSAAAGPAIGGLAIGLAGWRGIFWANIPVGLAAIAATALFVPDSRAARPRRADVAGQLLVIATLATASYAIIEGPRYGWGSPPVVAAALAAAGAGTAAIGYERRREQALIEVALLRRARFAACASCALLVNFAQGGLLFLMTLYLQEARGLSALAAGLVMAPMPAALAACCALSGRLAGGRGTRAAVAGGGAALALSGVAMAASLTSGSGLALPAAAYALAGAGIGLANPAITAGIVSGVPPAQASVASAMNSCARQLGIALGTAVLGSVLAASLHASMRAGFAAAARPDWWIIAGAGCAVALASWLAGRGAGPAPGTGAQPEARSPRQLRAPA